MEPPEVGLEPLPLVVDHRRSGDAAQQRARRHLTLSAALEGRTFDLLLLPPSTAATPWV